MAEMESCHWTELVIRRSSTSPVWVNSFLAHAGRVTDAPSEVQTRAQARSSSYMFMSFLAAGCVGAVVFQINPALPFFMTSAANLAAALIAIAGLRLAAPAKTTAGGQKVDAGRLTFGAWLELFGYSFMRAVVLTLQLLILPVWFFLDLKIEIAFFGVLFGLYTFSGFLGGRFYSRLAERFGACGALAVVLGVTLASLLGLGLGSAPWVTLLAPVGMFCAAGMLRPSTTELNFGLRVRKSDRFINDVGLTPQELSTFSLGVKHLRLDETARNSYDATLTFGTTLFGADQDAPGIGSDIPRAQFFKINAGWQRQGALGQAGTLVTDLRAQWSAHTLYGTEQLSLGSFSTVRGYEASVATGDMGVYMRNDLYLTPDIWKFLPEEAAGKVAGKIQTHLFLDIGITHDHARDVTGKAAGFGVGLSWYHKRLTLAGTLGVPLA